MSERETRIEAALSRALAPVSAELTSLEQEIETREQELRDLKALRTRTQKLLTVLDPTIEKPKRRSNGNSSKQLSEKQLAAILENIRAAYGFGDTERAFWAQDVSEAAGVHQTTANKALKTFHERGLVRLDHMGGARNTTKFFVLVGGADE